jgi:hypothetical protein|tara:strand:+ start:294 stop:599 length:306 start_codon:yes stop_codon:yes gene_type:complete
VAVLVLGLIVVEQEVLFQEERELQVKEIQAAVLKAAVLAAEAVLELLDKHQHLQHPFNILVVLVEMAHLHLSQVQMLLEQVVELVLINQDQQDHLGHQQVD